MKIFVNTAKAQPALPSPGGSETFIRPAAPINQIDGPAKDFPVGAPPVIKAEEIKIGGPSQVAPAGSQPLPIQSPAESRVISPTLAIFSALVLLLLSIIFLLRKKSRL